MREVYYPAEQTLEANAELTREHPALFPPLHPPGDGPSAEQRSRYDRGAGAPGRQRPHGAEDGPLALRHGAASRWFFGDRALQPPEHQAPGD